MEAAKITEGFSALSWVDIFIGLSLLTAFAMGVAGRGILHLSLVAATAILSFCAAYIFSGELAGTGLVPNSAIAGAILFAGSFAALSLIFRMLKKIPAADAALKITDGIVSAAVAVSAAVFIIGFAARWSDTSAAHNSALYSKASELLRLGADEVKKNIVEKPGDR